MQYLNYEFLPRQLEFMRNVDQIPYPAYIGGFGSGKSHILCLQALREAQVMKSYGLIGAPTYRILQDTTQRKFFELCPPQWLRSFHKSENRVELINGAEIIFRSLDAPGRLTNLGLDWFGLDEVGEIDLETFRMLQGRLRRPGGRHKGFGVGNPAGPAHWTYEYYVLKAKEHPNRYRLTQATSYENTFLAASYADEMTASYGIDTAYYKRYVLGEFVAFEGAFWSNFNTMSYPEGGHTVTDDSQIAELLGPRATWRFGRGIDFGFEHPFVCMWWITDGNRIVFVQEYWARHATIQQHILEIHRIEYELYKRFGVFQTQISWTDHDAQCRKEISACRDDNLNLIGFDCSIARKTVLESILLVQALFGQNKLYICDCCSNAILEVPSYRSKRDVIREEPIKEKDDTCDVIKMTCEMEMRESIGFLRIKDAGYELATLDNITNIGKDSLESMPCLSIP